MSEPDPAHPRLDALLGEAASCLPPDVAQTLETALMAGSDPPPQPSFFAALDIIRHGDCANGQPWTSARQARLSTADLAATNRSLRGLTVVLDLLHAAERSRQRAEEPHVDAYVIDGLMMAARQLATYAEDTMGKP